MSANNYILINRNNFNVTIRNADDSHVEQKVGKGKDIEDAIDIAERYQEIVEYGINFTEKKDNTRKSK